MERVVVKEAIVAELAEWVFLVAGAIWVAFPAVPSQLLSTVLSQLVRKEFEVLAANVAIDEAVGLAHVVAE
jgi:hypothetical protein